MIPLSAVFLLLAAAPSAPYDVVVLSDDYFSVTDDALKKLASILTIVGGKIVYDAGSLHVQDR